MTPELAETSSRGSFRGVDSESEGGFSKILNGGRDTAILIFGKTEKVARSKKLMTPELAETSSRGSFRGVDSESEGGFSKF